MRTEAMVGRTVGVAIGVVGALLLGACSNGGGSDPGVSTTSTSAAVTTEPTATESVTPDPEESTEADDSGDDQVGTEAAARAEIEAAVQGWYTFPYDSSKGEAGVPLVYLTDPLRLDYAGDAENHTTSGEIRRSRGRDRVEVLDLALDLDAGTAEISICSSGDHEIVDAATGEVIKADDQVPGEGLLYGSLTEDGWKLSEFFHSRAAGRNVACEFSEP